MNLFDELKKRNVFRVAAAYIVTAWLIVQVAETLFPVYGLSDAAVRIVVNILAIGLVPVLVLAWVFEWTPEGIKRESEVDDSAPALVLAAKRLDRMILVVLALALGYFAFDKFVLAPQREATVAQKARQEGRAEALVESYGDQSIAVLAFDDMSPDKDQEYLSDGLAEEVLNLLAQVPDLRVISRSSAFSFKGKDTPIPEIARVLNVAHILEGSVRKAGDRIRVTAQLIDARSDTHIWSQTYDRTLDDIFAIQDELAQAMVGELKISLLGDVPTARRVDPQAYMMYLQARRRLDLVDIDQALPLLERAVELDPDFADAWADLSAVYWQKSPTRTGKDHEGDEYWHKSHEALYRVSELDPGHPFLLGDQAWNAISNGQYVAAARLLTRGLERHPENWGLVLTAMIFTNVIGRYDIQLALAKAAVARDPLSADCSYHLSRAALRAGEYELAEQEILRFRALVPGAGGDLTLGSARLFMGDYEGAREAFTPSADFVRRDPRNAKIQESFGSLMLRAVTDDRTGIDEDIEKFISLAGDGEWLSFAQVYAMLGEKDKAFEWIYRGSDVTESIYLARFIRSPFLQNLHDDPRWLELLTSLGVAPHQLEGLEFNPRLPGA